MKHKRTDLYNLLSSFDLIRTVSLVHCDMLDKCIGGVKLISLYKFKLSTSLFKLQGSKRLKKATAYSLEITVLISLTSTSLYCDITVKCFLSSVV